MSKRFLQIPRSRRLLALAVCTYLAAVILTGVFQTRFIYFPSKVLAATPASVGLTFDDVTLLCADSTKISAWFVPHADALATILFFHGNAGNNGHRLEELRRFHQMQYNAMIVDYRGFGKSEGSPTESGTYLDAQAAWNYLTQTRNIPASSIIIMGESLGGAVAIDLASHHTPGALVVQSTFTRMADIAAMHYPFLPVRWLLRHSYDSIDKVGRISCPKLFIHSDADTLIPLPHGQSLFAAAADPKQFLQTPGEHNDGGFMYSPEYTARLKEFLDSLFP